MHRLPNKVSLITGAAQGIGLATALKFAQEGAIVIVCDVKQGAVDAAVRQCQALGAQAVGYVMDVTQRASVDSVVAQRQGPVWPHRRAGEQRRDHAGCAAGQDDAGAV